MTTSHHTNDQHTGTAAVDNVQRRSQVAGQELVTATVHLAGAVEVETAHSAQYSARHVQVRLGPVLLYLLDRDAAQALAGAAHATARRARDMFGRAPAGRLPTLGSEQAPGRQDVSLVVRLRGEQTTRDPKGWTAQVGADGRAHITCSVGGLTLVCHDGEVLHRLLYVASSAQSVAAALWPARSFDELEAHDRHAERWDRQHH